MNRQPDFENNLLRVMNKQKPQRATLFEMAITPKVYKRVLGHGATEPGFLGELKLAVDGMTKLGYDYAVCRAYGFKIRKDERVNYATRTMNGNGIICDWKSFEEYAWPKIEDFDYSPIEKIKPYMPEGMKLMIMSPNGVLENTIDLIGYDNLCMMLYDDPDLLKAVFDKVGSLLLGIYEITASMDTIGMICANDDWGFNTQTMLRPEQLREYVFPWHKKIVETAHKNNKPCMLHSCGYYNDIIGDVINDIQFDARHSYEDNIIPVEEAYEQLNGKIAVLGGIDVHFLTTSTPEEVYARSRAMLERAADRGGYALGSGNSIPDYIPYENFIAMTRAAIEFDR